MIKDVQNQKDLRNIPIQKVGVKDVEIPLKIERKPQDNKNNLEEVVYAKAKMSVSLPSHYKGTHMSRFLEILNKYRTKCLLTSDIEHILFDMKAKLAELNPDYRFMIRRSEFICPNLDYVLIAY